MVVVGVVVTTMGQAVVMVVVDMAVNKTLALRSILHKTFAQVQLLGLARSIWYILLCCRF